MKWILRIALAINAIAFIWWAWLYFAAMFLVRPEQFGCCSIWVGLRGAALALTPPGSAIIALWLAPKRRERRD
jgi:hypothetical protein